MTFREWLQDKFERQYFGLDDEMPDCQEDWFAELDVEDVIDWAEKWKDEIAGGEK